MMRRKKVMQYGITLIALVITIIILLILAGVTISLVVGENGILKRAEESARVTNTARDKEILEMEVAGALDENLKVNLEELKKNIGNSFPGVEITESEFPVTITLETGKYSISENGEVERLSGIGIVENNVIIEIIDGVAGSKKLTATLTDINGPITWSSSNVGVATVDNDGNVTAVGEGTTEITATCEGEVAKCNVTVKNVISISTINLKIGTNAVTAETVTQEIERGKTLIITAETDAEATEGITWESSEGSIATVKGSGDRNLTGTITGEQVSDTEVTITANGAKGVSASVKVKIIAPTELEAGDIASSTTCPTVMENEVIVDYLEYERKQYNNPSVDGTKSTDWQVLYADASNIYLIMKYTTSNPAGTVDLSSGVGSSAGYADGSPMLSDIDTNSETQNRFPAVKAGWFSKWMDQYKTDNTWTSNFENMQATMYMLDSNVWNKYVFGITGTNVLADWAIGGPTMEMFAKSYDKLRGTTNQYGKLMVKYGSTRGYDYSNFRNQNTVPERELLNNSEYYWIAAPSHDAVSAVILVNPYPERVETNFYNASMRFPLRCLSKIWSKISKRCDNRTL